MRSDRRPLASSLQAPPVGPGRPLRRPARQRRRATTTALGRATRQASEELGKSGGANPDPGETTGLPDQPAKRILMAPPVSLVTRINERTGIPLPEADCRRWNRESATIRHGRQCRRRLRNREQFRMRFLTPLAADEREGFPRLHAEELAQAHPMQPDGKGAYYRCAATRRCSRPAPAPASAIFKPPGPPQQPHRQTATNRRPGEHGPRAGRRRLARAA